MRLLIEKTPILRLLSEQQDILSYKMMFPIFMGALDTGDSVRFTSIFLASSFFGCQAESTPVPAPVTLAVG